MQKRMPIQRSIVIREIITTQEVMANEKTVETITREDYNEDNDDDDDDDDWIPS